MAVAKIDQMFSMSEAGLQQTLVEWTELLNSNFEVFVGVIDIILKYISLQFVQTLSPVVLEAVMKFYDDIICACIDKKYFFSFSSNHSLVM